MKKLVLGIALAALAMFVWGAIFWTVPVTYELAFETIPDEVTLAEDLRETIPASGAYLLPDPMGSEFEDVAARHRAGPVAMLLVRTEGAEPMAASVFIFGFLHMLATVILIALLLRAAVPTLETYRRRLAFVVLAGLAASVFANLGDPIWWHQPWSFHLTTGLYDLGAWTVAGLVLAAFVKPTPVPASVQSETVHRAAAA